MFGKDIEDLEPILHSASGGNLLAKYYLLSIVVHASIEVELARILARSCSHQRQHRCAAPTRCEDGPAGEAPSDFLNVLLGVTTINTKSVQLHQLACVVFINASPLPGCLNPSLLITFLPRLNLGITIHDPCRSPPSH